MNESQDGKGWVLVTGGTRGIGRGLVEAFAADGHEAVFTYQHAVDTADGLERSIALAGGRAQGLCCDCTDDEAVGALARELIARRGAPRAVINNIGITRDAALLRMSSEQWHAVINANLHSAFYVTRHFVGAMVERGDGVILQMSSVSGIKGNIGQTNYGATKAALIGMTRSLALELSRFNVRVNSVVPGFIATEMVAKIPEAQQAALKKSIPLRRFGRVQEVAALCRFLVSEDAAYMTGQTFVIDGGLAA